MSKPLWPAVSGAVARDMQVEVISNNLANVNTIGFKKDAVDFKEYLSRNEKEGDLAADIPRSPIKDKDLYPLEGRDQSFVVVNGTHTSFKSGGMKVTDNPLDLALNGPGFFEVASPAGIRYTKSGAFKLSPDGRLVTSEGHPVLAKGDAGSDPASRFIQLGGREGGIHINEAGELYAGDTLVSPLSVVEFGDLKTVRKTGGLYFENKNPVGNPPQNGVATLVKQGMLETSNVNPVEEISNLIRANRMFEQDLKAMKTVNEMLQREVNDIGKL
ncbi:MAG: flagellar hook-basal body protein [Bdellovibrionales bacterium]|nr:flagellar hook-basal body protein [Bdellovibrionales bacterium]